MKRVVLIALVYNAGTEQRGPQNVNGSHTLMARETVRVIAVARYAVRQVRQLIG